jgi:hypothetical protein
LKPKENQGYYPIGSIWINSTSPQEIWILSDINSVNSVTTAHWVLIANSTIEGPLLTLSDNAGTVVPPSSSISNPPGNIQFKSGGAGLTIVGNASTNTITITNTGASGTETLTGDDGVPVSPSGGTIQTLGNTVANATHAKPLYTTNPSTNIERFDIQVAAAIASTAINSVGLAAFSNTQFAVDGNGFVTLLGGTGAAVQQLTTSDSNTVIPSGSPENINLLGAGSVTTIGSGSTATVELTGLTAFSVLTGAGTTTINKVAPSVTSGVPLISQGSASQPIFGTAVVAGGGTGDTSFTAYSVITGGTTSTGALQNVVGVGTSGQLLTSNGAGALPTWQNAAASSVVSVTGTNGVTASPTTGAVVVSGVDATTSTVGVASFNSAQFTVTAGAVSLINGSNISGVTVDADSGSGTNPVVPNGSGLISILGGTTFSTGSRANPIEVVSTSANTASLEIQLAGASASVTPNDFGVAQFNSTNFTSTAGFITSNNITINTTGGISGGGTVTLGGALTLSGTSGSVAYTNVNHAASPYTVKLTDQYISCDTSAGTVSLLFPNSPPSFQTWIVKDRLGDASTNNISITTVGGGDVIDGVTTYKITSNYGAVQLLFNSTGYEVY